jgi:hypothetical protein
MPRRLMVRAWWDPLQHNFRSGLCFLEGRFRAGALSDYFGIRGSNKTPYSAAGLRTASRAVEGMVKPFRIPRCSRR